MVAPLGEFYVDGGTFFQVPAGLADLAPLRTLRAAGDIPYAELPVTDTTEEFDVIAIDSECGDHNPCTKSCT
ncbi:MAG: hypothetical protein LUP99_02175 [Methanomicrobiales archaeon]|nr:hypothetical protein [Methanomicrobiales archaeon]